MIPFVLNNFKLYIKNLAELSWEVKIETGKGGGGWSSYSNNVGLDLVCTVSLMSLCALFIREGEEVVIYPVHVNFSLYFKPW